MSRTRQLVEEELIRVAIQCFSERGYLRTTLEDIASRVGISRMTFYSYFDSKATLLKVICERSLSEYRRQLETLLKQPLPRLEKLRRAVALHIASLTSEQPLIQLFFREEAHLPEEVASTVTKIHREIDRLMEKEIERGIQRGEIMAEDPRLLMYAFTGMCNWLYRWYRPGGRITPADIIRVFTRVLESGCLMAKTHADDGAVAQSLARIEHHLKEVTQEFGKVSQQLRATVHRPRGQPRMKGNGARPVPPKP